MLIVWWRGSSMFGRSLLVCGCRTWPLVGLRPVAGSALFFSRAWNDMTCFEPKRAGGVRVHSRHRQFDKLQWCQRKIDPMVLQARTCMKVKMQWQRGVESGCSNHSLVRSEWMSVFCQKMSSTWIAGPRRNCESHSRASMSTYILSLGILYVQNQWQSGICLFNNGPMIQ